MNQGLSSSQSTLEGRGDESPIRKALLLCLISAGGGEQGLWPQLDAESECSCQLTPKLRPRGRHSQVPPPHCSGVRTQNPQCCPRTEGMAGEEHHGCPARQLCMPDTTSFRPSPARPLTEH
ncbi:hypothetical protein SKAU_G00043710 [Synaphobranchus kaupii]|uniref:Uncharacterized protein n=1 Tax=Synaphobranchus kaupii TaxID=118154 RepID=A0A9Q1G2F9_SYNKA|nr:hypothetical protein SKAU_G00043710 [Synaphobranchus kaupii]